MITCPIRQEADPEGGDLGGGASLTSGSTTPSWRDALNVSDEVKSWQGLSNIKDPSDAISQLYNAQKLIGVDKLAKPQDNWTDKQWGDFYGKLGRPESPDKYEFQLDEKLSASVDKEQLEEFKTAFHEAGLTPKQAEKIVSTYLQKESARNESYQQEMQKQQQGALNELLIEWGDHSEANTQMAKMALKKFGDEGITKLLNETGLHAHPTMLRFFHKLAGSIQESGAIGNSGGMVNSAAGAKMTLSQKMQDATWVDALVNPQNPNHDRVVQERIALYKMMIPE